MEFTPDGKPLTPEQVKAKHAKMHCKLCGKDMIGKSTFSRHLGAAHNDLSPEKRERILVDEYFGPATVSRVLKDYKAGKFNLSNLPIDLTRYIYLAQIKQKKDLYIPHEETKRENPRKKFTLIVIDRNGILGEKPTVSDDPDNPNYIAYSVKGISILSGTNDICLKVQRVPRDKPFPSSSVSYAALKNYIENHEDSEKGQIFVAKISDDKLNPVPARYVKISTRKFKISKINKKKIAQIRKKLNLQKAAQDIINKKAGNLSPLTRHRDKSLKNKKSPTIQDQEKQGKQRYDIVEYCRIFV